MIKHKSKSLFINLFTFLLLIFLSNLVYALRNPAAVYCSAL